MLPTTAHCSRQACRGALRTSRLVSPTRSSIAPQQFAIPGLINRQICFAISLRGYATAVKLQPQAAVAAAASSPAPTKARTDAQPVAKALPDLAKLNYLIDQTRNRFLSAEGIPSTQLTIAALKTLDAAAATIKPHLNRKDLPSRPSTASSTLLALDKDGTQKDSIRVTDTADKISKAAHDIITHPNVVMNSEVLSRYVDVQCLLGRPETFPNVFELFGTKALPKKVGSSIVYKRQNPKRMNAAIDLDIAEKALKAAMAAKHLDAAIGIVETCYTGRPFLIQKLIRTVSLPGIVTAAVPFAVYGLSQQFASLHPSIDSATATKITFAGATAYLVFTVSLGMFAKATAMDHMVRVTWQSGTPMRERWVREDERAALDQIALAWGFKEKWRHGEEVGVEWASLREYTGQKGMILDRVEFMEGMNG